MDKFDFEGPDLNWYETGHDVVGKYYSTMEAEVAAARLRSEGIPCFLANATAQSVLTHIPAYLRLHVRPQDAERAHTLLAEAVIDAEGDAPIARTGNGILYLLAAGIGGILVYLLAAARK